MNLRIVGLGLAVAGAIAPASMALARTVPERFVVSGKAAEQIQDFTTINLATADGWRMRARRRRPPKACRSA